MVVKLQELIRKRKFVDSLRLLIRAGTGGHGFPKYGGVGGAGGDIFVEGYKDVSLKEIAQKNPSKRISAKHGENSLKNRILGRKGDDVVIQVPVGVTLYDEQGKSIGEINREGDRVLVAKGGIGGNKLTGFCGLTGQKFVVTLDLKLIADIGLVGFPNAGKSTLLSILSKAKPKIASYPFTTIQPNLGILEYPDLRKISMADLPGLIEGAHANVGMGHSFLKHVERTKLLLLVVDISGFRLGPKYNSRSCLETVILLNKELELYKEELLDKPAALIINKLDLPDSREKFKEIHQACQNLRDYFPYLPERVRPNRALNFTNIYGMSAISNDPGEVEHVKSTIRKILDDFAVKDDDADLELLQTIDKERKKAAPYLV